MTPDELKAWGEEFMRLSVLHGFSARTYLHYSQAGPPDRGRWRRTEEANDAAPPAPAAPEKNGCRAGAEPVQ